MHNKFPYKNLLTPVHLCRICNNKIETINHILTECKHLYGVYREIKGRYNLLYQEIKPLMLLYALPKDVSLFNQLCHVRFHIFQYLRYKPHALNINEINELLLKLYFVIIK